MFVTTRVRYNWVNLCAKITNLPLKSLLKTECSLTSKFVITEFHCTFRINRLKAYRLINIEFLLLKFLPKKSFELFYFSPFSSISTTASFESDRMAMTHQNVFTANYSGETKLGCFEIFSD